MQKENIQRFIRSLLFILCIAGLVSAAVLIYSYQSYKRQTVGTACSTITGMTKKAARNIDEILKGAVAAADSLAAGMTEGRVGKEEGRERLKTMLEVSPYFYGGSVTYKPYSYDAGRRLFSAYYHKGAGKPLQYVQLDKVYDYTAPEHEWYSLASEKGSVWSQPYFDEAGQTSMVTYSSVFYSENGSTHRKTFAGVVTIDISLDEIKRIIQSLDLGPSGFGGLISNKGVYLYHPVSDYVKNQRTIFDIARELNDNDRLRVGEKAINGESGFIEHTSRTTGLSSWLIYEPVPSTGWSVQNTFIKDDIPLDMDRMRRNRLRIAVALIVFGLTLSALLLRAYAGGHRRLWMMSAVASVLLGAGIGYIWHVALTTGVHAKTGEVNLIDRISLSNFKNSYNKKCAELHESRPLYVSTGIFIRSLEFSESRKVKVSGQIWQKYDDTIHKGLAEGVAFPDAVDVSISEAYTRREKDTKITGWDFQGVFYQQLDYTTYPVDAGKLSIRINPRDMGGDVILVPDLDSYKFQNPSSLPGMEKSILLPGWKFEKSFFSLKTIGYDTDLGIRDFSKRDRLPQLHFNIMIQRNVIDAFIRSMTPLIVVSFLIFIVILLMSRDPEKSTLALDVRGTVGFSGSMFFVVIFAHITTRNAISAQEIFYLEHFYFLMYLALLWTTVSAILFRTDALRVLNYKDNFVSKVIFWPVTLGYLFVVTLVTFY